jgi:hypothetical protein
MPLENAKTPRGRRSLRAVSGDGAQLRRWVQQSHLTPAGGRSKPGRFDKMEEESAACTTAGPRGYPRDSAGSSGRSWGSGLAASPSTSGLWSTASKILCSAETSAPCE